MSCSISAEADGEEWAKEMKRQKDGVVVLGAALGSEDFVGDYRK